MLISDISLAKKLSLSFGIMLFMLSGLLVFNNFTINFSQDNFNKLLLNDITIENIADDVDISLLQLRRREKDFLLRNNLSYVQQHQAEWAKLQTHIEKLNRLAFQNQNQHLGISEHVEKLSQYADNYRVNFANLVSVKVTMGLNSSSGLQGDFTQTAHSLSATLAEYDVANLYQQLLLIRRWEKDFVRTQDAKYMQRLASTLIKYENMLKLSLSEFNSKKAQQQALSGYNQALAHYLKQQGDSEKLVAYEQVRSFAHKMEVAIMDIFIENGPALALQIRRSEKDYLLTGDIKHANKANESILALRKQIQDSNIATKHSNKLLELLTSYDFSFNLLTAENKLAASHTQTLRNAAHKMEPLLHVIKSIIEKSKKSSFNTTLESITHRQSISLVVGILILLVGLFATIILSRSINQPINAMMKVVANIARGDLSQRFESNRGDEIGKLATSINLMVETLNQIADQADLIAKGDFSVEILPKSKTDKLAISLNEMKNQISYRTRLMQESEAALQTANMTLVQQNELKNQLSKMTELDQQDNYLQAICDKAISALAKLTGSGHGALYVVDENDDKLNNSLTLIGSYALKKKHVYHVIPIGAGLVGQCAKELQTIIITEVPGDYIYINSALGEQSPLNLMLTPVIFEQKLIAVIELASFTPFVQAQQDMLQQVTEYIGFIINQQKNKRLLRVLQGGSESLK